MPFAINFMPHGHCYMWNPGLIGLHVVSDAVIALAYFSIRLALAKFVRARKDLAFHWMFVCFAAFILACGTTHAMAIYTLWVPAYWLSGFVKLVTAVVSIATAVLLWPLIPRALALPSPSELEAANLELKNTQAQLVHTAKLASLGQLVAGIAHEVNNPLSFSINHIHNIQRWMDKLAESPNPTEDPKWDKCVRRLGEARQGLERIGELVLRLRTLSRVDTPEMKSANVHEMLQTTLLFLQYHIGERIEVQTEYTENGVIECFPGHLSQVFMNLLMNAAQAIPEGQPGSIKISTRRTGTEFWISIADSGVGMTEEQQKKIFEPFYTTRPVGSGMGLGMAITAQIVEAHCGTIKVTSKPGEGTAVAVELPLTQGS